jgi:hypothetical protein
MALPEYGFPCARLMPGLRILLPSKTRRVTMWCLSAGMTATPESPGASSREARSDGAAIGSPGPPAPRGRARPVGASLRRPSSLDMAAVSSEPG